MVFFKCDKSSNVIKQIYLLAIGLLFEVKLVFSESLDYPEYGIKNFTGRVFEQLWKDDVMCDVLPKDNYEPLEVSFAGHEFDFGNEVPPEALAHQPVVKWPAPHRSKYTLVCLGPDTPTKIKASTGDWLHWHVGNIPENQTSRGNVRVEYVGLSREVYEPGRHRVVVLLFRQPDDSDFYYINDVIKTDNFYDREFFSPAVMCKEHGMKHAVAVNYAWVNV